MFNLSSIRSRTYTNECDLSKIADLVNTCAIVDNLDIGTSVNELHQEFSEPDFDQLQDLRLWCDEKDNLIGFGQLWIPPSNITSDEDLCYLWFRVLPITRNGDIEAQIIRWGLQRVQMVSQERQRQAKLCTIVRESECDRAAFLQSNGFIAERFFYCLERSLLQTIPIPQSPSGFTVRQVEGEHEGEAWVNLYNQTFSEHWDFHPMTIEQWHADRMDSDYQTEYDLVAVNEDGTLVAFCCSEIRQEQNARTRRNEGWINLLGTHPSFRGYGLGRTMLLAGLHQLKQSGVETVLLGVDSGNSSGALQLYEAVGFCQRSATTTYAKCVQNID